MLRVQLMSYSKDEIDQFTNLFDDKKMIGLDYYSINEDHIFTFHLNTPFHLKRESVTNSENVTVQKLSKPMEQELKAEIEQLKGIIEQLKRPKQDTTKNRSLVAMVGLYRSSGLSLQKIADKLNGEGLTNSRNNPFNKMQIKRLYDLYLKEQKDLLQK